MTPDGALAADLASIVALAGANKRGRQRAILFQAALRYKRRSRQEKQLAAEASTKSACEQRFAEGPAGLH
jgi:hypothetical protein